MKVKKWLKMLGITLAAISLTTLSGTREVKADANISVASSVSGATGNVGDIVTVPISFNGNVNQLRGIHGELNGNYDSSYLEYKGVEYAGIPAGMESTAGGNFGYITATDFQSGTINIKFKILKCSPNPIPVTIKNLYYSYKDQETFGDTDSTELTVNITANHPTDKNVVEIIDPTCTTPGKKTVKCGLCGAVISEEVLAATGHTEGEWVVEKPATCKEEGVRVLKCKVCGAELKREAIAKTEHNWKFVKVIQEATCKEEGKKLMKCSICGDEKEVSIPKKEHTWVVNEKTDKNGWEVVEEPTEKKEGKKTRVCSICGEEETQTIAKLVPKPVKPDADKKDDTKKEDPKKDKDKKDTDQKVTDKKDNKKDNDKKGTDKKVQGKPAAGTKTAAPAKNTKPASDKATVKTGDESNIAVYGVLLGVAVLGAAGVLVFKKRKNNK